MAGDRPVLIQKFQRSFCEKSHRIFRCFPSFFCLPNPKHAWAGTADKDDTAASFLHVPVPALYASCQKSVPVLQNILRYFAIVQISAFCKSSIRYFVLLYIIIGYFFALNLVLKNDVIVVIINIFSPSPDAAQASASSIQDFFACICRFPTYLNSNVYVWCFLIRTRSYPHQTVFTLLIVPN